MTLLAIEYGPASAAQKAIFDAIPNKTGDYWDRDDECVKRIKKEIKDFYLLQQDFTCVYCRQRIVVQHHAAWDTEHIIPKSSHPQFMFEPKNLCIACKDCNNEKRAKDVLKNPRRITFPSVSGDYLMVHPHFDSYGDHIHLLPHSLFFMPRSEKGVHTIEICGLLRFLLAYVDYGVTDTKIKKEIALRNTLLVETNDPAEEMLLMAELEALFAEQKKISRKNGMQNLLEKGGLAYCG